MRFALLLLAFAVTAAACSGPPRDEPVTDEPAPDEPMTDEMATVALGEPLTVELGTEVRVGDEGTVIRFDAVGADSRCPADVTCVRAGEATAQFTLVEAGGLERPFTLPFPGLVIEMPTYEQVQLQQVDRFIIAPYLLQPYPGVAEQEGMPTTATLEVRFVTR